MRKIGTNSGACIRTKPGRRFQCQWTLTLGDGSIQIAGVGALCRHVIALNRDVFLAHTLNRDACPCSAQNHGS